MATERIWDEKAGKYVYVKKTSDKNTEVSTVKVASNSDSYSNSDWDEFLKKKYASAAIMDTGTANRNIAGKSAVVQDNMYKLGGSGVIKNSEVLPTLGRYGQYGAINTRNMNAGREYLDMTDDEFKQLLELAKTDSEAAKMVYNIGKARTGGLDAIDMSGMPKVQQRELGRMGNLSQTDDVYAALSQTAAETQKPNIGKLFDDPNQYAQFVASGASMPGAEQKNLFGETVTNDDQLSVLLGERKTYDDYLKMYSAYPSEALRKDLMNIQSYNTKRNVYAVTPEQYEASRARVYAATGTDYDSIARESGGTDNKWMLDALGNYEAGEKYLAENVFGEVSEEDWYRYHDAYMNYMESSSRQGNKLDTWEEEADRQTNAQLNASDGIDYYRPAPMYLNIDPTYLEGHREYQNEDGAYMPAEEYRGNAINEWLMAYVDAGNDEAKIKALDEARGEYLPELEQYNLDKLRYLDPDQQKAIFTAFNNGDVETAKNLIQTYDPILNYQRVGDMEKEWKQKYNDASTAEKIGMNVQSVGQNVGTALEGVKQAVWSIVAPDELKKITEYDPAYDKTRQANITRQLTGGEIAQATEGVNIPFTDRNLVEAIYHGVMSGADSFVIANLLAPIGPAAQAIAMGGISFANERMGKLEAGYSESDANMDAWIQSFIEGVTEYIPFDIMSKNSPHAWRKALGGIYAGSVGEGVSELGGALYDEIKYGDYRDQLLVEGNRGSEASLWLKWLEHVGPDVASATIGGLFGESPMQIVSASSENRQNKTFGENLRTNDGKQVLADLAETLPVSKQAKDIIARMRAEMSERTKGDKAEGDIADGAAVTKEDADAAMKAAEMKARNKAVKEQKHKAVKNAEVGYVYREVMRHLDEGAKNIVAKSFARDTLETELAQAGFRGDMRKAANDVANFITGKADNNTFERIKENSAMRNVALSYMAEIETAQAELYSKAGELAQRASKDYVKPESTKAEKGAQEATQGIDDRAAISAEDIEVSDVPESTVDGKAVTIEGVASVAEDGSVTFSVKDADGNVSEVSEADVAYGQNDAGIAAVAQNAKELGANADSMLKAYNSEQNAAEYSAAFKQAVQYGDDGRNLDVIKNDSALSTLTEQQIEIAYNIGRGVRTGRNDAMVRKNASGVKVGQVDTSAINMRALKANQMATVRSMTNIAKAIGFNVKFVESKANAEGRYTTENGRWDPKTLTLTLDVHAGSNSTKDTNYAMIHTAGHELTHYIKQFADGDMWNAYQEFVVGHLSKKDGAEFNLENEITSRMNAEGLARDAAIVEVIADASGEALNRISEADIQSLAETNPGLMSKIKQFFKQWIGNLKKMISTAYKGTEAKNEVARQMMDAVDEMGKRWNALLVNAAKNRAENVVSETTNAKEDAASTATETVLPYTHIDQRTFDSVAEKETELFCSEVEEAQIGMAAAANILLADLENSIPGQKVWMPDNEVTGQKRQTSALLGRMKDDLNLTWDGLRQRLQQFAGMENQEQIPKNTVNNRRIELYLNEMLTEGYTTLDGTKINAWPEYIDAVQSLEGADVQKKYSSIHGAVDFVDYAWPEEYGQKFSVLRPVEYTKNLVAVHNLTESKLQKALKLGGFPMPSIAITKADIGHSNFGNISLVFGSETVDPEFMRRNTVYSADAWTPTFPQIEYEVNEKAEKRIKDKYYALAKAHGYDFVRPMYTIANNLEEQLNRYGGEEGLIDHLRDDTNMMQMYIAETKGEPVANVTHEKVTRIAPELVKKYEYFIGKLGRDVVLETEVKDGESPIMRRKAWLEKHGEKLNEAYLSYLAEAGIDEETAKIVLQETKPMKLVMEVVNARKYIKNGAETVTVETDTNATDAAIRKAATGYEEWLNDLIRGTVKDSGVYNNKELYTASGNRRSFKQTHYSVTLENIAKSMAGQNEGNSRNVSGFYGVKSLRAGTAKRFKSIAEMHELAGRLKKLTESEAQSINDALAERLDVLMNKIYNTKSHNQHGDMFLAMDAIGNMLMEAAELSNKSVENIKKVCADYHYKLNDSVVNEIRELLFDVEQMPVNIFEAKPERAVGFDEVRYAIVPDSLSNDTLNALRNEVHDVRVYPDGDESARIELLNAREDLKFQKRDLSNLTDRDLLVSALETDLSEAERSHLSKYKEKVEQLNKDQRKLEELNTKIVELRNAGYTARTSEELRAAETNVATLRRRIDREDAKLKEIESAAMIKEVIKRNREAARKQAYTLARQRADERQRKAVEHAREVGERRVQRLKESQAKEKYKKRILEDVKKLHTWVASPTNKGSVPEFLREPLAEFIDSIDFRSGKALSAGKALETGAAEEWLKQATQRRDNAKVRYDKALAEYEEIKKTGTDEQIKKAKRKMSLAKGNYEIEARAVEQGIEASAMEYTAQDKKFTEALDKVREAVSKLNKQYAGLDGGAEAFAGFVDLTGDFAEEFDKLVRDIKDTLGRGRDLTDTPFNRMSAQQLKEMSQMFKVLRTSIRQMNMNLANSRYESNRTMSRDGIDELGEMKARTKTNKALELLNSTFNWKNTTPYYAFERLGRAGKAVFEALQDGWDKMARNSSRVINYAKDTFNEQESKAWSSEIDTIELESGETVQMTTAQKMSLYCHTKREQSRGHLMGGGIRMSDIDGKHGSKITQAEDYVLTENDIANIIDSLTDRQREVADKLQRFMNTVCAEWGNEISMKRFGFEQMTEKNYFPIKTDSNNRASIDEDKDGRTSMFRLLNMSSLKPLTPGANNAIIIEDIFNVFSDHASDMAKYNALALPILDFIKWYNYVERNDIVDESGNPTGKYTTRSTQKSLERVFGKDAKEYLRAFIKDLNAEHDGGRNDGLINNIVGKAKSAAVGANLRVYALQVTSLPRAAYAINPKYLIAGAAKLKSLNPANAIKGTEAQEKIGILQWKKLGFYSTDINRSTREMIKRNEGWLGKVRDWQMTPAGWGDNWVSNIIYEAAKAEMKDKHSDIREGTAEYDYMLNKRVREIVYKTQVVDSTMTRSDLMRSKGLASMVTAFMSEPTLTVNMLSESIHKAIEQGRKGGNVGEILRATGGLATRAATVWIYISIVTALMESVWDALRDDDEYEKFYEKFWNALWGDKWYEGNFVQNLNPVTMFPILNDAWSIMIEGYEDNSLIMQVFSQFKSFFDAIGSYKKGSTTLYNVIYKGAQTVSSMSGVGAANAARDGVALYNTFLAPAWNTPKAQTYQDSASTAASAYYGALKENRTEDAAYYKRRMEVDGIDQAKVADKVATLIGDDYVAGNITEANARKWFDSETALDDKKIDTKMRDLNFKAETGVNYGDFKSAYLAGTISKTQAQGLLKKYRGYDDNKVYFTLLEWEGGEGWSRYDAFLDAVDAQRNFAAEAKKLLDHGVNKSDIASAIASAYKDAYKQIHGTAEGNRLLEYLLDVYESIGYDRDYERKYITKNWIKD